MSVISQLTLDGFEISRIWRTLIKFSSQSVLCLVGSFHDVGTAGQRKICRPNGSAKVFTEYLLEPAAFVRVAKEEGMSKAKQILAV